MAPPLPSSPRRSEGTIRCASSSSFSVCKESSRGSSNRAQRRRFPELVAVHLLQFRPPSSSSGQTEHTPGFLVFSRTFDAISLLLVRSQATNPSPTRAPFRHGLHPRVSSRLLQIK
jgi:hypothetical protein